MGRRATQNMLRQTGLSENRHIYRCKAMTKSGARCRRRGPNGYCHLHRLKSVSEEMAEAAVKG